MISMNRHKTQTSAAGPRRSNHSNLEMEAEFLTKKRVLLGVKYLKNKKC